MTLAVINVTNGAVIDASGTQYVIAAGGAELVAGYVVTAQNAAARAEAAAAATLSAAGIGEYADTATGLAGTSVGETFWVDQGNGVGLIYRHDAGPVATPLRPFIIDIADSGAAGLIGATGGTVQTSIDALSARFDETLGLGQLHRVMSILDSASGDVNIVIPTDSTGDTLTEWTGLLFGGLVAAAYPSWTIQLRFWSGSSYAAATTLQTGFNGCTLLVSVAAVAGSVANRFAGADFKAAIVDPQPDCIWLSYGHNADIYSIGGGAVASRPERQRTWFAPLADKIGKRLPDVPVVLIGQNPSTNNNGTNAPGTDDGFMRARLEILFPFAARRKWGVINVHDAFLQSPLPLSTLVPDGTHPGEPLGSQLWADTVWSVMRASRAAQEAGGAASPVMLRKWTGFADFDTWSKGNVDVTTATGETRPSAAAITIVSTAGMGYAHIRPLTAADWPAVRGRPITFGVWMNVPSASEVHAGRIDIIDSVKITVSQGPVRGTGWALFTVTHYCEDTSTPDLPVIYLYAAEGAFSPASAIIADRASLSLGVEAVDPITAEDPPAAPVLPAFRGALVRKAANQTGANYAGSANVAWDSETYDTDGFHDTVTNNSRLTVPSGVTRVRLSAQMRYTNGTNGEFVALAINKNGGGYDGLAYQVVASPTGAGCVNVHTPVITVAATDYFEVNFQVQTDTSVDIQAGLSWFAIEVIE